MANILDRINCCSDVKKLNKKETLQLCDEIRAVLTDTVSKTGGHLASNLGTVELTVALHRVFDCPKDSIIFDVGHQGYTHKLLTGRSKEFSTLRSKNGLSGFPKPSESDCDPFIEGHSSTSISSAIGLARANLIRRNTKSKVLAVIGDGSFSGGMVYEAINNIDKSLTNLVVILNDNSMSISKSVGAVARYLLRLRSGVKYSNFKRSVQTALEKAPIIGKPIVNTLLKSKSAIRRAMYDGTFFEEMGFHYLGPVDGHDLDELVRILKNIKDLEGPILLHVITTKGKGFAPAEENPGAYHGVGQFDLEDGNPDISLADSFSNAFGQKLNRLAQKDSKICAITAAMKYGTGLQYFYKAHKDRFFDVGIAEQHAVTFSAGLAKGGLKPVFAVYSTFLQRAFDQLSQDVSIDSLNVMLAVDRAGLVGEDGETHQGLFDVMMLGSLNGFRVASPCNYNELDYYLEKLINVKGPTAVRYPRGKEDERLHEYKATTNDYDLIKLSDKNDLLFITYGREFAEVYEAAKKLNEDGVCCDVLKLNMILPINKDAVNDSKKYNKVYFFEESARRGGLGEEFSDALYSLGYDGAFKLFAVNTPIVRQASVEEQLAENELDALSIYKNIMKDNK